MFHKPARSFRRESGTESTCYRLEACQLLYRNRSAVRKHAFLCTGVFEGAWPNDHFQEIPGRAVAGRAARARLADSPGEVCMVDARKPADKSVRHSPLRSGKNLIRTV